MRLTSGCGGIYRSQLSHRTVPHPSPFITDFVDALFRYADDGTF